MGDEAAAIPIEVVVHTDTRNLKSQPFIPSSDQISTGKLWEEWAESIEREFRYFKITEPLDKKDALIIFGGKEIARLSKSLPDPIANPDGPQLNEYELLRSKLNDYFTPIRNIHHARYIFLQMKPLPSENTCMYASRLREKAPTCEFGQSNDDRILEHIIQTIENRSLIQKTINKGWTLTQFLREASQVEDTTLQVKQMRDESDTISSAHRVKQHKGRDKDKHSAQRNYGSGNQQCSYCGRTDHQPGRNCPAYGKNARNVER